MKHKHYNKIVAKAANMSLVVFCRDTYHIGEGWFETHNLPIQDEFDYYLCLPQHKEDCLAWLNGANINFIFDGWSDVVAEEAPWTVYNNTLQVSDLTDEQAVELFVAWRKGGAIQYRVEDEWYDTSMPTWLNMNVYRIKSKSELDLFVEKAITVAKDADADGVASLVMALHNAGCRFV